MAKSSNYIAATGGNSAGQLRAFIERAERMAEEKKAISEDTKEIFAEAKANGFDPKIMKIIIKRRAADAAELAEQDALIDTYSKSLGMASPADSDDEGSGE